MKLTSFAAFALLPLVLASPLTADETVKDKIAQLDARAPAVVTGTVTADALKYRRCANTGCEAVGQYPRGTVISIQCRVHGESINGWDWWDRLTNGYYVSDFYVSWTGGVPPVC